MGRCGRYWGNTAGSRPSYQIYRTLLFWVCRKVTCRSWGSKRGPTVGGLIGFLISNILRASPVYLRKSSAFPSSAKYKAAMPPHPSGGIAAMSLEQRRRSRASPQIERQSRRKAAARAAFRSISPTRSRSITPTPARSGHRGSQPKRTRPTTSNATRP